MMDEAQRRGLGGGFLIQPRPILRNPGFCWDLPIGIRRYGMPELIFNTHFCLNLEGFCWNGHVSDFYGHTGHNELR